MRDNPESQQKVRARIHYRQHCIFMRHTHHSKRERERERQREGDQRLAATEQAAYNVHSGSGDNLCHATLEFE